MSEHKHPPDPPTSRRAIRAAERAAERARRQGSAPPSGAASTSAGSVSGEAAPGSDATGQNTPQRSSTSPMTAPTEGVPDREVDQTGETSAVTVPTEVVAAFDRDTVIDPEPKAVLAAEAPAPARAGRNLPWAIGVGLVLGAVIVASLFIRSEAFLLVAIAACGIGLWELERALRTRDIRIPLLPLVVGAVGMLVSAYTSGIEALLVAFLLTSGGAFIWRVLDGTGASAMRDASAGIFAAAYVPFLAGFVMLMLAEDNGAWLVLAFITLVVANDVGGYVAGVFFGRHPMAPTVSPKKSWEGFAGSLLLASLTGAGFAVFALDAPWWAGVGLGVLAVSAATLGDLAESLIKRDLGVKDMGNLLPGHGGIMDRMDSILVAAPVVFTVHLLLLRG